MREKERQREKEKEKRKKRGEKWKKGEKREKAEKVWCPQDFLNMSLAEMLETIDVLAEMLEI